ncbi:ornithine cyclodeaminase [Actinocorallia herbida]|uniref:Ornithine cyclodeaminase n=1 Tax=Actinocorallia herbida TaxID=58109 RepID=A0A3N1D6D7_9ACTN|nr:ornithine cyclodeaminase family protein [Actinocorallia herbida]ROO89095.1 ornithine cyclodeaminase [Actinocorallia herbida]
MNGARVLDARATAAALDPEAVVAAVAVALSAISDGTASAPPRVAAFAPGGLLGAMPGYVPGLGLGAKLVSVFADPGHAGRSAHRGVVVLFDERDGSVLAVMDGEPITEVRTAAVATVAMRALARPGARRVAVIGTGSQAAAQVALLAALHPDLPLMVGGRRPSAAAALAARHPNGTSAGIEDAVRAAEIVLCCTDARTPVLDHSWLVPGAHVGSVGGFHGPEIPADTVASATLFAEWPGAAASPLPAGAHELQGVPPERVTLLGDVLAGRHRGRVSESEITFFKSTGHAAFDVAAAHVVHTRSREEGSGLLL